MRGGRAQCLPHYLLGQDRLTQFILVHWWSAPNINPFGGKYLKSLVLRFGDHFLVCKPTLFRVDTHCFPTGVMSKPNIMPSLQHNHITWVHPIQLLPYIFQEFYIVGTSIKHQIMLIQVRTNSLSKMHPYSRDEDEQFLPSLHYL